MNAHTQLPPSDRDFAVHRLVKVEQRSTREAAEALRISQTRVCQVLEKVAAFMVEVAPAQEDDAQEAQRLRVAKWVASERLDFLIGQAMAGFRQSQGTETTEREVESLTGGRAKIRTTRTNFGDARYLLAAARLTMLASKLPAGGLAMVQASTEPEIETETKTDDTDLSVPPVEACSTSSDEQVETAPAEPAETPVSVSQSEPCAASSSAATNPVARSAPPVQPASSQDEPKTKREFTRLRARRQFLAAAG